MFDLIFRNEVFIMFVKMDWFLFGFLFDGFNVVVLCCRCERNFFVNWMVNDICKDGVDLMVNDLMVIFGSFYRVNVVVDVCWNIFDCISVKILWYRFNSII